MSQKSIAPLTKSKAEYFLKSLSGKLKGTTFKMSSKEIYIGRDKSNHISVPEDESLSRKHARFILHQGKFYVQNLSPTNYIKVNNERVKQTELKNNFVISIGAQSFKFISNSAELSHTAPTPNVSQKSTQKTYDFHKKRQNKNTLAIAMIVLVVGLYFYLQPQSQSRLKKEREIATTEKIFERINETEADYKNLSEQLEARGKNSKEYKEAEKFYIKGFRDFQKGLYAAARSSFESSLSLDPSHKLSRRYLDLSKNRMEELISFHMNQGRVHLEDSRFNLCISSLKNTLSYTYDKTDPRYKEAKILLKKCKALNRSKY